MNASAIVISSAWPSTDNGAGFAVTSLLDECARAFRRVHLIGLTEEGPGWANATYSEMQWTHVQISKLPRPIRFLLSLGKPVPAVCHQFLSERIVNHVLEGIQQTIAHTDRAVIILEDLPIAISLLPAIRGRFPKIRIAIRSENVLSKIFEPLTSHGSLPSMIAWRIEVSKMRQSEISICRNADRVWAISRNDQQEYLTRLGIICSGVFGVSLDHSRFAQVPPGNSQTVVYVGGVDLRKRLGLVDFIERVWPVVRLEVPEAQLILAGNGTQNLNDPQNGIHGLGYVADDRDVWAKGQIALNPQELGSGIKLKSIIAMLSARALVSTAVGTEGIEGTSGIHFLIATDARALAPLCVQLMKNPSQAALMGFEARKLAQEMYSQHRLTASVGPLLDDLMNGSATDSAYSMTNQR